MIHLLNESKLCSSVMMSFRFKERNWPTYVLIIISFEKVMNRVLSSRIDTKFPTDSVISE